MSEGEATEPLILDFHFAEPPAKVWRAIAIPHYREHWLPGSDLADPEPVSIEEGRSVRYAVRDRDPPHHRSEVTFDISAAEGGGTRLRIVHAPPAERPAANTNQPPSALLAA